MSANAAHFDDNQVPTMMGAIGTLGTADTGGTAKSLPFGIDPATGAMHVNVINGTVSTTLALNSGTITTIQAGTQNTLGTVGNLNNGSINVLTGTITSLTSGSLSNIAMINAGTLVQASGTTTLVSTVTTLSNLTNGSVNILTGTLQSSGTATGVGVVSNLTNGSVNVLTGTLAVSLGTVGGKAASAAAAVANPVTIAGTDSGGTVYSPLVTTGGIMAANMPTGTVTTGTLALVSTVTTVSNLTNGSANVLSGTLQSSGTTTGVGVVSNLTNGSINVLTGTTTLVSTVTTLSNLTNGSVNVLTGTTAVNTKTVGSILLTYGTLGTTGAAVYGTMVSAVGAGTSIYLTGLSIVVQSGTVDCAIANGTFGPAGGPGGANVYARGAFPAGGGVARPYPNVVQSGTNGTLIYWMGGAGTAYFLADYWIGP